MPGVASSFEEPARLQLLKRKLEALNYTDVLEPGAAPLTEKARNLLLSEPVLRMSPLVDALCDRPPPFQCGIQ